MRTENKVQPPKFIRLQVSDRGLAEEIAAGLTDTLEIDASNGHRPTRIAEYERVVAKDDNVQKGGD